MRKAVGLRHPTAFLRSIEADLADTTPMLAFADWLEEHGKEQLAYAWRWMARRGYRPAKRVLPGSHSHWAWWHTHSRIMEQDPEDTRDLHHHPEAQLPSAVFRALAAGPAESAHVYCHTLTEAAERLAWGLEALRELIALERQPDDP